LEKHLHIITLTVPYPVDYGGVFDLFYKLSALQQTGVHIHLHCFDYGRGQQPELNRYCASVNYYERKSWPLSFSNELPYIVASRKNDALLDELLKDDYPILMEGIHCSYLLTDERFANRKTYLRLHNVEYEYYQHLTASATSFIKKRFYKRESELLHQYEKAIANKPTAIWSVTKKDALTYRREFNCNCIEYLPLFLSPDWKVDSIVGKGTYCFYQGDLSVDANAKAATWLLKEVFNDVEIPFVLAGKNPSKKLIKLAHAQMHTCIVANPCDREMQDMVRRSHMHILPSYSNTGIKLKLLNALFNGRHCLVNNDTVEGSGLESLCHIANSATGFKEKVKELYEKSFTCNEIDKRKALLNNMFNNKANAKRINESIWGE